MAIHLCNAFFILVASAAVFRLGSCEIFNKTNSPTPGSSAFNPVYTSKHPQLVDRMLTGAFGDGNFTLPWWFNYTVPTPPYVPDPPEHKPGLSALQWFLLFIAIIIIVVFLISCCIWGNYIQTKRYFFFI